MVMVDCGTNICSSDIILGICIFYMDINNNLKWIRIKGYRMDYLIFKFVLLAAFSQVVLKFLGIIRYSWWIICLTSGFVFLICILCLGYIIWDRCP